MDGGVRGHLLNCGKTATNTCIIMLRLPWRRPGNSATIKQDLECPKCIAPFNFSVH